MSSFLCAHTKQLQQIQELLSKCQVKRNLNLNDLKRKNLINMFQGLLNVTVIFRSFVFTPVFQISSLLKKTTKNNNNQQQSPAKTYALFDLLTNFWKCQKTAFSINDSNQHLVSSGLSDFTSSLFTKTECFSRLSESGSMFTNRQES